jgi:hypothetical protein
VLLKQDFDILREEIDVGRVTFANTLNYNLTTISANFGNMFSMAGASLLLIFLSLLAPQILLKNFLSDIPATTIASEVLPSQTGWALARGLSIYPITEEALPILNSLDGKSTLEELQTTHGQDGLDFIGELIRRGFVSIGKDYHDLRKGKKFISHILLWIPRLPHSSSQYRKSRGD